MELKEFTTNDISASSYQPILQFHHMGTGPPMNLSPLQLSHRKYFNKYRDETVSRMRPVYDKLDLPKLVYTPFTSNVKKSNNFLYFPQMQISMVDAARQQEVDNFYMICQMHRDQYKDHTFRLHPLDYFKKSDYMYQNSPDPTNVYMKCPIGYVKYKNPLVYPLTTERTLRTFPSLPEKTFTGVYNRISIPTRR